ncbi:1-deoxy-D-xylulose-5-phosphate reductoisomerase [Desulfitispora alkaliphila]|uniref:1-deoxy-D-xylulose-5-phosphate reductoisomerase n=1 Tax=Desulfitispora alkaliphila TaxID=622674 RepID=UPI003D21A724
MKSIAILGSTGSIGTQALDIVDWHPSQFDVDLISVNKNIELLEEQIDKYSPSYAVIMNEEKGNHFVKSGRSGKCKVFVGMEGMLEAIRLTKADTVVTALSGVVGLKPTVEAIKAGKNIALANKETLVAAGQLVMSLAHEHGVSVLPVDSEHSALFQCMIGEDEQTIEKIILTASGGPFRKADKETLETVTPEMALKHPNWNMGGKISIDSATMMNKGLEVIEAKWLFGLDNEKIEVVVHPESIVHSMVQYLDGSFLAHLGSPDMRIPIQYALTYPARMKTEVERLNFTKLASLTFEAADEEKFPCLKLAYDAMKIGETMPAVMNAANEIAVDAFLNRRIKFTEIPLLIQQCMKEHNPIKNANLDDVLKADNWAREITHINISR